MRDLSEYLAIAQQAVEIGSHLMSTTPPGTVREKNDRDLVTDLDLKIQRETKAYLAESAPEVHFLGEEDDGSALDEAAECIWSLDPIDGTSNFAHGLPLCATSLALILHGAPVVAVIDAPFLGLRYHATADTGAYCNDAPIHASDTTELKRAIVSLGDYATGPDAEQKNRRRFAVTQVLAENVERVRMFGAASLDLAWVAEGRIDACVILSNKPWDTAAGSLLVRGSGALITDNDGNPHNANSAATIAASSTIATPLISLTQTSIHSVCAKNID